jgi:hypothetical protein
MRSIMSALLVAATIAPACAETKAIADGAAEIELAKMQGTWVRTVETDDGKVKLVKEHKGNWTSLTIYDSKGNVVAAKKSEFRLEQTGKVRIFTFFNNVITAGPQQGRVDKTPKSYIYRISDDTFYEVNGMLVGDGDEPISFAWRRVKAL